MPQTPVARGLVGFACGFLSEKKSITAIALKLTGNIKGVTTDHGNWGVGIMFRPYCHLEKNICSEKASLEVEGWSAYQI